MNVPVVILTYNRKQFLIDVLAEHDRVNTPKPIFIFDDGSEDISVIESLRENKDYICVPLRHQHYRNQFLEIGRIMGKMGHKYFVFTEDDASFSINWYQWTIKALSKLDSQYEVGAFSLYSGHDNPNGRKVIPYVYKHTNGHFYGTCGIVVNTNYIEDIKETMRNDRYRNPDIAIRKMSVDKYLSLFVTFPNIVQHEGVGKSLVIAPEHRSRTFIGNNKDSLEELSF